MILWVFQKQDLIIIIPDKNVSIPNYTLYRNDRKRDGGGVAVFVKQTPSYTHILRNDLMPNELEIIVLEIKPNNTRKVEKDHLP